MTVLDDGQYEFNGRAVGPGTDYYVQGVAGPGRKVRTSDGDRPDGPGLYLGPEWPAARPIVIDLRIVGTDEANAWTKYQALCDSWTLRGTEGQVGTLPVIFKRPGQDQRRWGNSRVRDIITNTSQLKKLQVIDLSVTFDAETPFEFSDVEHSYDLVYNGSSVTIDNAGNYPAAVTYDVYGLVTDPGVIRSETDRFDLNTAIGNSDFYRVRTDARTITRASDAANLYETWVAGSTWLEIPAGGALFRTIGTGGSGSVKTRMFWRDTWWN